jgi:hypothetical protein
LYIEMVSLGGAAIPIPDLGYTGCNLCCPNPGLAAIK